MNHSIKKYAFAALMTGLVSFAPYAHAATTTDIQMLPPLSFDYKSVCASASGSPQLLAWDGTNPINCIPGVTGDKTGLLTAPSISAPNISNTTLTTNSITSAAIANSGALSSNSLTSNDLFLYNAFGNNFISVAGTVVDLSIMAGCTNGAALTKNTNGTFGCINVADIPNVGTTFVQQCSTPGTMLYFDNTKGFSCVQIPYPAIPPFPPTCTGNNALQYNASTNTYACQAVVTSLPPPPTFPTPPVCPDGLGGVALQFNGSSYTCAPLSALGVVQAAGCTGFPGQYAGNNVSPAVQFPNGASMTQTGSDGCSQWLMQCQNGTWVDIYTLNAACGSGSSIE